MKYYCLIICFGLLACKNKDANQLITLSFKADADVEMLQIYKIQQGSNELINEFSLKKGEEKRVTDSSENVFFLFKQGRKTFKAYARKGQKISVTVSVDGFIDNNSTKENKLLSEWHQISNEARLLSIEYYKGDMKKVNQITPFYEAQKQLEKQRIPFLEKLNKNKDNDYFTKALRALIQAEINHFKLFHKQIPTIATSIKDLPKELYQTIISPERLNDPILLDAFEHCIAYIQLYGAWNQRKDRKKGKPVVEYVGSPNIQVAYLVHMAKFYKDGRKLKAIKENYAHLFQSGEALEQLKKLEKDLKLRDENARLSKITLKNPKGELVNLSDFEGKLLVIDMWATWCGPCVKSRPAFEKLAHEMRDEEVVFVAISIDKSEMSWKKIAEKSKGIELLDFESSFSNAYGVGSIPHFLIFDRKGKILDASAPRPGTGQLKKRITDYLKSSKS